MLAFLTVFPTTSNVNSMISMKVANLVMVSVARSWRRRKWLYLTATPSGIVSSSSAAPMALATGMCHALGRCRMLVCCRHRRPVDPSLPTIFHYAVYWANLDCRTRSLPRFAGCVVCRALLIAARANNYAFASCYPRSVSAFSVF